MLLQQQACDINVSVNAYVAPYAAAECTWSAACAVCAALSFLTVVDVVSVRAGNRQSVFVTHKELNELHHARSLARSHTQGFLFARTLACTHKGLIPYHVVQQQQLNYAHSCSCEQLLLP